MMKLSFLFLFSIASIVSINAQDKAVTNGRELIKAMNDAYKGKWYRNLTFVQQTGFYKDGKLEREQIWYEAMNLEKGLVIKFDSLTSANGFIFKNDSQFVYRDNTVINKARRVHDLIVLGFSVYFDSPEVTINKIKESGYNIESFRTESNNGKIEYVVGDPATSQFWIDAKTLLFVRLQKKQSDGSVSEIKFENYIQLGKAWIETEVVFYKDGKITMREVYSDIRTPKKLPSNLFKSNDFKSMVW